jgi:hypothetical protein
MELDMSRPAGQKCGNCRFFEVRNEAEVDLARIAKDESECAPGEWVFEGRRNVGCHGGPVRGMCAKWRERGAPGPAILSTQWCNLWQDGGPVIRAAGAMAGSPNKGGSTVATDSVSAKIDRSGGFLAIGLVGLLSAVGAWAKARR